MVSSGKRLWMRWWVEYITLRKRASLNLVIRVNHTPTVTNTESVLYTTVDSGFSETVAECGMNQIRFAAVRTPPRELCAVPDPGPRLVGRPHSLPHRCLRSFVFRACCASIVGPWICLLPTWTGNSMVRTPLWFSVATTPQISVQQTAT